MTDEELIERVRVAFSVLDDFIDANALLNSADALSAALIEDRNDPLMKIPGSPWWVIRDDTRLTRSAMETGQIVVEHQLKDLPEVRALQPGDVVLDIGAYVGDTALIFLERSCEVHSFEPYADAVEAMRRNVAAFRFGTGKTFIYPRAVGDGRPMTASGRLGEPNGNIGTRMVESAPDGEPTLRIDDLNLPRVDFAKIDCEGCEPLVLDGMAETIRRCRPILLIEAYNDLLAAQGFTRLDLFHRLSQLNYEWRVAVGDKRDPRVDFLAYPAQEQ